MTLLSFPCAARARTFTAALLLAALAAGGARAGDSAGPGDAVRGIEQALVAAQQDKRGITLYVGGQAIGGAVTRVEPGLWVELRSQAASRIIVRLDRVDGLAAP